MIYIIVSTLPESGHDKSERNYIYTLDIVPFYYTNETDANERKAELDRDFPDWQNEVISLTER